MENLEIKQLKYGFLFRPNRNKANKRQTKSNQQGKIYARILFEDEKPLELYANVKCIRSKWDSSRGRLKSRDEKSKIYNQTLTILENRILKNHNDFINKEIEFGLNDIKGSITGEYFDRNELIKQFDIFIENEKGGWASSTYKHYQTTRKYLKLFLSDKFNTDTMPLSRINYSFIKSFDFWLKDEKSCQAVGAGKHHIRINNFLNECVKHEKTNVRPYDNFKIERGESNKVALTRKELTAIEQLNLDSEALERVRDAFVLACYTGLSYAELNGFTRTSNILEDDFIVGERFKTKVPFEVKIISKAKALLEKYKEDPIVKQKDCLMPTISNQKMNAALKMIAINGGIIKNVTVHMARHTFATTTVLECGGSIESLKSMLGHTNIKTTEIYAKVSKKRAAEEMTKIDIKLSVIEC